MMKRILQLGALVFALISTGGALAIPLSDLLAGATITAGDKIFDRWSLIQFITPDPDRVFNPSNIEVTALNDGGLNPGPGLRFSVSNNELSVTGDGIFNFIDFAFGFHVTAPAGLTISDISLNDLGGLLQTSSPGGFEDLGATILEWAGSALVLDPTTPGFISSEFSALAGVTTFPVDASKLIAPSQDIWITKDILVWAVNPLESATLNAFEQRFSQQTTVPEPGTLALLSLAMVGLGARLRRRNG